MSLRSCLERDHRENSNSRLPAMQKSEAGAAPHHARSRLTYTDNGVQKSAIMEHLGAWGCICSRDWEMFCIGSGALLRV